MKTPSRVLAPLSALLIFASSSGTAAKPGDPTVRGAAHASGADIQAQIRAMRAAMKPDQGFMWRPPVRDGKTVAAIEIWKKPGRPAVHPADAEYATVLEGSGALVSGGALVDPKTSNPGLVEGSRIAGGVTRTLGPGDVILVPAGVPHGFEITGDRLVLLGIKLPDANWSVPRHGYYARPGLEAVMNLRRVQRPVSS